MSEYDFSAAPFSLAFAGSGSYARRTRMASPLDNSLRHAEDEILVNDLSTSQRVVPSFKVRREQTR